MKTRTPTPAEMAKRTARFDDLQPYSQQQASENAIPTGAMEKLTAHRVYPVMVPADYTGRSAQAPIKAGERTIISIAECPPHNGPGLHNHESSIETFFCLQGRFDVTWGDAGEHCVTLEPMDLVSVPPGVMRAFRNVSDEVGRLFVVIEASGAAAQDRVAYATSVGEEVNAEYGAETLAALQKIGFKFDAGQTDA